MKPTFSRQELVSGALIALICMLAFVVAMLAVPKISAASGMSEDTVAYVVAAVVFVFVIWSGLLVKSKIER
jgi:hypothetical protein